MLLVKESFSSFLTTARHFVIPRAEVKGENYKNVTVLQI